MFARRLLIPWFFIVLIRLGNLRSFLFLPRGVVQFFTGAWQLFPWLAILFSVSKAHDVGLINFLLPWAMVGWAVFFRPLVMAIICRKCAILMHWRTRLVTIVIFLVTIVLISFRFESPSISRNRTTVLWVLTSGTFTQRVLNCVPKLFSLVPAFIFRQFDRWLPIWS